MRSFLRKSLTTAASAALVSSALITAAQAQTVTKHDGWTTIRTAENCMTMRNGNSMFERSVLYVMNADSLDLVVLRVQASKYPYLANSTSRDVTLRLYVIDYYETPHRLSFPAQLARDGEHLSIIFRDEIFDYLRDGNGIQIQNQDDISQNISFTYGDINKAISEYRQCEGIRTGQADPQTQGSNPSLDSLPPFDRAKRVCDLETQQTQGLVPADNPYELDGRRYANACDAARDYAYRQMRRID